MRPSGPIPDWSSDTNYPVSADPWSATATKIDPGGVVANGFKPKSKAPAQFFNWILNRLALFLLAYDGIDAQNWTLLGAPPVVTALVPSTKPLALDPTTKQMWLIGASLGAPKVIRSYDGVNWTDETANLPAAPVTGNAIVFSSINGFMWYVSSNSTSLTSRDNAGTWAKITCPNATSVGVVDFDPIETPKPFLFGGKSNTNHPAVWRGNETLGSIVSATLTNAATYTGAIVAHAKGPNRAVAFALCTAPAAETRQWDVDIWSNNWTDRGVPFPVGENPMGLAYGSTDDLFMAITDAGTVYVSSGGTAWTLQATLANTVFVAGSLNARGSVWVAVADITVSGSSRWIVWSVDQGVTWHQTPYPADQAADVICVIPVLDCLAIVTGATGINISTTLRAL